MPEVKVISPKIVSPYFTPREAAKYLRVGPSTLARYRMDKNHPLRFVLCGTMIRYLKEDLDAWMRGNLKRRTVSPFVGRPPKNRRAAAERRAAFRASKKRARAN